MYNDLIKEKLSITYIKIFSMDAKKNYSFKNREETETFSL
jgi:hypothetical protein